MIGLKLFPALSAEYGNAISSAVIEALDVDDGYKKFLQQRLFAVDNTVTEKAKAQEPRTTPAVETGDSRSQ